jgi:hypothetical protein
MLAVSMPPIIHLSIEYQNILIIVLSSLNVSITMKSVAAGYENVLPDT